MTRPESLRNHGDEVMVFAATGTYLLRGRIIGVHRAESPFYDVLPRGERSWAKAMLSVPHDRLRSVGKPILAYERRADTGPKYISDEA